MKKVHLIFLVVLVSVILLQGCKKDPVADPNEEELITTLKVKLVDKNSGAESIFLFRDLDGEGGAAPQKFDTIKLVRGLSYDCSLQMLNESVSPADDITNEIIAEAEDHQVYITPSASLIVVASMDKDSKGLPLGITSTWRAAANPGMGIVNITLKHKAGAKAAGDTVDKGETDISLDFPLKVQ